MSGINIFWNYTKQVYQITNLDTDCSIYVNYFYQYNATPPDQQYWYKDNNTLVSKEGTFNQLGFNLNNTLYCYSLSYYNFLRQSPASYHINVYFVNDYITFAVPTFMTITAFQDLIAQEFRKLNKSIYQPGLLNLTNNLCDESHLISQEQLSDYSSIRVIDKASKSMSIGSQMQGSQPYNKEPSQNYTQIYNNQNNYSPFSNTSSSNTQYDDNSNNNSPFSNSQYNGNSNNNTPFNDNSNNNSPFSNTQYNNNSNNNSPFSNTQYNNNSNNNTPYGNTAYDNNQYGNNQYGNTPYGNNQYGNTQFNNTQYGNTPYGNTQFNNTQYGNTQYDSNQYDSNQYDSNQYDSNSNNNTQYGNAPYGNNQYGNTQYGNNQYGSNSNNNTPYGNTQYSNTQYGNNQYGNNQYGNNASPSQQNQVEPMPSVLPTSTPQQSSMLTPNINEVNTMNPNEFIPNMNTNDERNSSLSNDSSSFSCSESSSSEFNDDDEEIDSDSSDDAGIDISNTRSNEIKYVINSKQSNYVPFIKDETVNQFVNRLQNTEDWKNIIKNDDYLIVYDNKDIKEAGFLFSQFSSKLVIFIYQIHHITQEKILSTSIYTNSLSLTKEQVLNVECEYQISNNMTLKDINNIFMELPKETPYIEMINTTSISVYYVLERSVKGTHLRVCKASIPLLDTYSIDPTDNENKTKQYLELPPTLMHHDIRININCGNDTDFRQPVDETIIKHYMMYLPIDDSLPVSFNNRNVTNLFYDFPTDFVINPETSGILTGTVNKNGLYDIKIINPTEISLYSNFIFNSNNQSVTFSSCLHRGLMNMVKQEEFSFSYIDTSKKIIKFLLPDLDTNMRKTANIMPDILYFYCLRNVKNKKISFNRLAEFVSIFDNVICHSSQPQVDVVIDNMTYSFKPYQQNLAQNSHLKPELTNEAVSRYKLVHNSVKEKDVNLLIEGTTASAKTFTVELVCDQLQLPLLRFNFSPSTTIEDLIGDYIIKNINGRQKLVFTEGAFTLAFIHGYVLLLDELSLAKESVVEPLMGILDTQELYISGKNNNRAYKMHPNFRIICTQNPAGSAYERTKFSERILDHFRFVDQNRFPPMKPEELDRISKKIITDLQSQSKAIKVHKEAMKRNEQRKLNQKQDNKEVYEDRITPVMKEYTIRDLSRVKMFLTKTEASIDYALHLIYESAFNKSFSNIPITYCKSSLSQSLWNKFYNDMEVALEAGNHILVVSSNAYTSSCYTNAFLEYKKSSYDQEKNKSSNRGKSPYLVEDYTSLYGCSNLSNDVLIGSYIFKNKESKLPEWQDSALLKAIGKGYPCLFESLHLLKSNVIERLNSLLELIPNDGNHHLVRFDERNQDPIIKMNDNFRIIATVEEDSISRFSPALLNRFLVVYINNKQKNLNDYNQNPLNTNSYSIYHNEIYDDDNLNLKKTVSIKEKNLNYFEKVEFSQLLNYLSRLINDPKDFQEYINYYRNNYLKNSYNVSLARLEREKIHNKYFNETFMNLCINRSLCISGSTDSGKSYLLNSLCASMNIIDRVDLHLSSESDFSELMGFYSINYVFNHGIILDAIEKGKLLVLDHAENITKDMFEQFQQFMDPLRTSFTYCHQEFNIHPSFRIVFLFTTQRDYLPYKLPQYMKRISIPEYTNDEIISIIDIDDVKQLKSCIKTKSVSLSYLIKCKTIFNSLNESSFSYLNIVVLFSKIVGSLLKQIADNNSLENFLNSKVYVTKSKSQNKDYFDYDIKKQSIQTRIRLYKDCTKYLSNNWFCEALFKCSLVQNIYPMIFVGLGEDKHLLINALYPSISNIELAHSLECFHLIGQTTLLDKTSLMNMTNTLRRYESEKTSILFKVWYDYLVKQRDNNISSSLLFQPGVILDSIILNKTACLNNLDLLSKDIYPRLKTLLHYTNNEGFIEDLNNEFYSMLDSETNSSNDSGHFIHRFLPICSTCEPHLYSNVSMFDDFFPIFCDSVSNEEITKRYPVLNTLVSSKYFKDIRGNILEELKRMNITPNMIKILQQIYPAFNSQNPIFDALFFLTYCLSDNYSRKTLRKVCYLEAVNEDLIKLLKYDNDKDDEEVTKDQIYVVFTKDISESIWSLFDKSDSEKKFFPVKTIVLMASALVIGHKYNVPIILEGAPGIGKSDCVDKLFHHSNVCLQRFNFSPNSTIQDYFGTFIIGEENNLIFKMGDLTKFLYLSPSEPHVLLLDEINLAPMDVIEVLSSLVKAAYSESKEFYIPGDKSMTLPPLYIISALNPAAMSAQRNSLPSSMTSICLFFKDISYSLFELITISQNIIESSTLTPYSDYEGNFTIYDQNCDTLKTPEFSKKLQDLFIKTIQYSREFRTPFSLRDTIKVKELCVSGNLPIYAALWIVFGCKYYGDSYKSISNTLAFNTSADIVERLKNNKLSFSGPYGIELPIKKNEKHRNFTSLESLLLYKLALSYNTKRAIIIYGPSPSGKSYTVEQLARILNKPLNRIPMHPEISSSALLGEKKIIDTEDGVRIRFVEGPLPHAMRTGEWILIEDIHLASGELLERFNSLCEEHPTFKLLESDEHTIFVGDEPEHDYEIHIHDDFRLFLTMSTKDISTIPPPLLSRCIIIATDCLSNNKNVQELSAIIGNDIKPEYFGPDESKSFRRALRVLQTNKEEQYKEEYGYKFKHYERLIEGWESDAVDDFIKLLHKKEYVDIIIDKFIPLLHVTIDEFQDETYLKVIEESLQVYRESLIIYPLNILLETVKKNPNLNKPLLTDELSCFIPLSHWLICKDYKLEMTDQMKTHVDRVPPILSDDFTFVEDYYVLKESPIIANIMFCYLKNRYEGLYDIKHIKDHSDYYSELITIISSDIFKNFKSLYTFVSSFVTITEGDDEIKKNEYIIERDDTIKIATQKNQQIRTLKEKIDLAKNDLGEHSLSKKIINLYDNICGMISGYQKVFSSIQDHDSIKANKESALNHFRFALGQYQGDILNKFKEIESKISVEKMHTYYQNAVRFPRDIDYSSFTDQEKNSKGINFTQLYIKCSHFIVFSEELRHKKQSIVSSFFKFYDIFDSIHLNTNNMFIYLDKLDDLYDELKDYINIYMCYIANKCCFNSRVNKKASLFLTEMSKYDFYEHSNEFEQDTIYSCIQALGEHELLCDEAQALYSNFKMNKSKIQKKLFCDNNLFEKHSLDLYLNVLSIKEKLDTNEIRSFEDKDYPYLAIYDKSYQGLRPVEPGEILPQIVLQSEAKLISNCRLTETDSFIISCGIDKWEQISLICPYLRTDEFALLYSLIDSIIQDKDRKQFIYKYKAEINDIHTIIEVLDNIQIKIYNDSKSQLEHDCNNLQISIDENKSYSNGILKQLNDEYKSINKKANDYVNQMRKQNSHFYDLASVNTYNYICTQMYNQAMNNFMKKEELLKSLRYNDSAMKGVSSQLFNRYALRSTPSYSNSIKVAYITCKNAVKEQLVNIILRTGIKNDNKNISILLKDSVLYTNRLERPYLYYTDQSNRVKKSVFVLALPYSCYDISIQDSDQYSVEYRYCNISNEETILSLMSVDYYYQTYKKVTLLLLRMMINLYRSYFKGIYNDYPEASKNEVGQFIVTNGKEISWSYDIQSVSYDQKTLFASITYSSGISSLFTSSVQEIKYYSFYPNIREGRLYQLIFASNSEVVNLNAKSYSVKNDQVKERRYVLSDVFNAYKNENKYYTINYCDEQIDDLTNYRQLESEYKKIANDISVKQREFNNKEHTLTQIPKPELFSETVFIDSSVRNAYSGSSNYKLKDCIVVLSDSFHDIILPKDNTFHLPDFVPDIHAPSISIQIINPKNIPIEVIDPVSIASVVDSRLYLKFDSLLKSQDHVEQEVVLKIGSNELSINFIVNANKNDKILYTSAECRIYDNTTLQCDMKNNKITYKYEGKSYPMINRRNYDNQVLFKPFFIRFAYDSYWDKPKYSQYFVVQGAKLSYFKGLFEGKNELDLHSYKNKESFEEKIFSNDVVKYLEAINMLPLLLATDNKDHDLACKVMNNFERYGSHFNLYIQRKIASLHNLIDSSSTTTWSEIENESILSKKKAITEDDSSDDEDQNIPDNEQPKVEEEEEYSSHLHFVDSSKNRSKSLKTGTRIVMSGDVSKAVKASQLVLNGEDGMDDEPIDSNENNKLTDEEKKEIQEKKKRDAEESQNNQQTIESSDVIKRFEIMDLNTIFEKHVISRIKNKEYVEPKCTSKNNKLFNKQNSIIDKVFNDSTKIYDEIKPLLSRIYDAVFNNSFTDSSGQFELNQHSYIQCVSIILDMNVTHRKRKSRLRTEVAILILYLCNELGIPTRIYCTGARGQGFIISEEDDCLTSKISKVFDLECVKKTPSTPLDIFCYEDIEINDKTSYFLISDCFSEQLLSNLPVIQNALTKILPHFFLIHIKGNGDEALSSQNEIKLEQSLETGFKVDFIISIQTLEECKQLTKKRQFIKLFYSDNVLEYNKSTNVISFDNNDILKTSMPLFDNDNDSENSYAVSKYQNAGQYTIHLPEINDSFLFYEPFYSVNDQLFSFLSGKVPSDALFEALNNSILTPNKPTSWVPSTTGTIINTSAFFKFILTGSGDGRFFKKKTGNKIRDYAVSIVIDASQQAFCDINKSHSYSTILLLLRGLSEMALSHIDIFIARETCIKVVTGISSDRLWSQSVICSILNCLRTPYNNTCMSTTIKYAYSTMRIRSESSILFVFTNGTVCREEHGNIQKIFTSSDITAIGVGIGYMLHAYEDMYPTFIWSANPKAIRDSLLNMSYDSATKIAYDIKENDPTYTRLSELNVVVTNQDMTQNIINTKGKYEGIAGRYQLFAMSDEGTKEGGKKQMDSSFDLVKDNSLKGERVLFIILYLCRNDVDKKTKKIIDPDITKENLEIGKLIHGHKMSPVYKLVSKGMRVDIVYDYKHAIDALMSGDYRETFITCSPGDGKLPNTDYDGTNEPTIEFEDNDLIRFINCLNIFVNNGGNIMFMLENYPYSYEAEIYFKEFYHFDLIPDTKAEIQGGQTMKLDATKGKETADKPGTFIKVGTDPLQNSEVFPIGTGITQIFEGNTLAAMNENALKANNFTVFARDSEGNAAIMLSYGDNKKGRIIIDSAASKLFLEFTSESTARWISNSSAWLLNQERYYTDAYDGNEIPHGLNIPYNPNLYEHKFEVERRNFGKSPNFILSILLDCTGSMSSIIIQTRDNIIRALNDLERIKTQEGYDSTEIYCQFIGYRNYPQTGGTQQLPSPLTTNISEVRDYIQNNVNSNGGTNCGCADVEGAIELANKRTRHFIKEENVHVIIIMGDMPAFGCLSGCSCTNRGKHTYTGESYSTRWTNRARELVETDTSIYFLPIDGDYLLLTKDMLSRYYDGSKLKQSSNATDSTFSNIFVGLIKDSFVETMRGIS